MSVFRVCHDAELKPQPPRNPEVVVVTNTLACACYFFWLVNTPIAYTNTAHIYIYLLHGNDTEQTTEEAFEDQSQHKHLTQKGTVCFLHLPLVRNDEHFVSES